MLLPSNNLKYEVFSATLLTLKINLNEFKYQSSTDDSIAVDHVCQKEKATLYTFSMMFRPMRKGQKFPSEKAAATNSAVLAP